MKKNKKLLKCYYGSASAKQKGENKHVEGFELQIPCNGMTYAEKLNEIKESLQSSMSYGNCKNISDFSNVTVISVK